ncbi:TIGR04282 family arsenosugar biosynthesis glycosyltransferase [Thiovibrio sp. JS02]
MTKVTQAKLVLFTRYPEAGRAKTRLIPALGPEGAATLHRRLTERAVAQMRRFLAASPVAGEIRFAGGDRDRMEQWLAGRLPCRPQEGNSLGERLQAAFAAAFAEGAEQVVIIGADCPGLDPKILAEAFAALTQADLVLGPAADGGYYLVGLTRPWAELFHAIPWGSGEVLTKTLCRAKALNLKIRLLEQLVDVDRPEDLRHFRDYPHPQ